MSELYTPGSIPEEYDSQVLIEEFRRIAIALAEMETFTIIISPQHVEPLRKQEGMVVHADGTNWNPGAGAGLYVRIGGAWVKL